MTNQPTYAPEAPAQKGHNELGQLPVWNLDDLYPGNDSPQLKADLETARNEAKAFEADYKGKLEALAKSGQLVAAIKRYEALSDVSGKLGSYAFLQYVRNTQDPEKAKFLGDLSQALTDLSTGLIFFGLELNRIDEAVLEQALCRRCRRSPTTGRGSPNCARPSPTSSRTRSRSCSTRSR